MICPECNVWTRTLETRERPGHQTYRRYECANGHIVRTLESAITVPMTRADRIRQLLRECPEGASVDFMAEELNVPLKTMRRSLTTMRDVYIKGYGLASQSLWAVAESRRDVPPNAPKPKPKEKGQKQC